MAGRGRKGPGRPGKRIKLSNPVKSILKKSSRNQSLSRGTTTDAGTSGDETPRRHKTPVRVTNVSTSNQFNVGNNPLSDYDDDEVILTRTYNQARAKKMAPIVVVGMNTTELRTLLQPIVQTNAFTIRAMSTGTRLDVPNENEHKHVKGLLTQKHIAHYAYHSPNSKPLKFVLHGLCAQRIDELKNTLKELEIVPEDIKALNIKKKRYEQQAVYLLYFAPGSMSLSRLREIKHIDHVAVRWERYQPKQGANVAQCRNCQMYGHSSVNCAMPAKCLVCAENHKTDACTKRIPKLVLKQQQQEEAASPDRSFILCANCGKNHTANYLGCEKRKSFLEAQAKIANLRHKHRPNSKKVSFLDSESFPPLGPNYNRNGAHIPLNEPTQPPWAEVIQEMKKEQSSSVTIMQTLQSMMQSLNTMIGQMSQLIEVLVQQTAFMQRGPLTSTGIN